MRSVNDYIPTLIAVIVCICILIRLYRTAIKEGHSSRLVFFAFATAALLLSALYWVTFDILYPMQRLPFAANEIAEWAMFLSLTSVISSLIYLPSRSAIWEIILAVLFVTTNVALWIAWSGEWLQDIITGLVFCCFLIKLVIILKQEEVFSLTVRIVWSIVCAAILAVNIATFFVSGTLYVVYDLTSYILLIAVELYFIAKTVMSLYKNANQKVTVSLSFTTAAWSIIFLYMSSQIFYDIANICLTVSFILMSVSLRREAVS